MEFPGIAQNIHVPDIKVLSWLIQGLDEIFALNKWPRGLDALLELKT